jgi:hypothetical protein
VTLTAPDGSSTTVHTRAHGSFEIPAMAGPGSYTLTGRSPQYGDGRYLCHGAHPVQVVEHEMSHVNVLCQLK